MLIWLAVACSDPEYGHLGKALEAYEDGRVALATGAPEVAAEAFAKASSLDPDRAGLVAWEVRALRSLGADHQALSRLNAGVQRFRDSELLRFERAKLRAKLGQFSGAAEDLVWLYEREAVHPVNVGEMEAFRSLKTDPSTKELVPDPIVTAQVWAPDEAVVVGETHPIEFEITSRTGTPVEILPSDVGDGDLEVVRIIEDVVQSNTIWTKRVVRAERVATEAGPTVLGPWVIQAGSAMAITDRVVVNAIALEGALAMDGTDKRGVVSLMVPSSRFPDGGPSFEPDIQGHSWAILPAGTVLESSELSIGPHMSLRQSGQPVWTAQYVHPKAEARIKRGGAVVLEHSAGD